MYFILLSSKAPTISTNIIFHSTVKEFRSRLNFRCNVRIIYKIYTNILMFDKIKSKISLTVLITGQMILCQVIIIIFDAVIRTKQHQSKNVHKLKSSLSNVLRNPVFLIQLALVLYYLYSQKCQLPPLKSQQCSRCSYNVTAQRV